MYYVYVCVCLTGRVSPYFTISFKIKQQDNLFCFDLVIQEVVRGELLSELFFIYKSSVWCTEVYLLVKLVPNENRVSDS